MRPADVLRKRASNGQNACNASSGAWVCPPNTAILAAKPFRQIGCPEISLAGPAGRKDTAFGAEPNSSGRVDRSSVGVDRLHHSARSAAIAMDSLQIAPRRPELAASMAARAADSSTVAPDIAANAMDNSTIAVGRAAYAMDSPANARPKGINRDFASRNARTTSRMSRPTSPMSRSTVRIACSTVRIGCSTVDNGWNAVRNAFPPVRNAFPPVLMSHAPATNAFFIGRIGVDGLRIAESSPRYSRKPVRMSGHLLPNRHSQSGDAIPRLRMTRLTVAYVRTTLPISRSAGSIRSFSGNKSEKGPRVSR